MSIARRLQDPLAELVKIDPKSIGVGQYQHDVNQSQLARSLDAVVEDCVNAVGVDVNTASAALLARVSGLNSSIAGNIVSYRDSHGAFANRKTLLKVPRLGDKTFEQAAGFLRIMNGDNPLDRSAVHPEAYELVERIIARCNKPVTALIGDASAPENPQTQRLHRRALWPAHGDGHPARAGKPGRDPRPEFKTAAFADGVEDLADLRPGMILEGVVTNVANFGALSTLACIRTAWCIFQPLSKQFVDDPRKVVKAGDVVKVKVMEVDVKRKRIGLSMRLDDEPGASTARGPRRQYPGAQGRRQTARGGSADQ